MALVFRDLRADEIDCRVATINENGLSLLLYKDARCDMNILDEAVGAMNWQRAHSRDNANCTVSIWDSEKQMWISKEDVGTESNTEAVKGLASDSFKRACFNWGIGRELYTAPHIWVKRGLYKETPKNGKPTTYDKFSVSSITIKDKKITGLQIVNDNSGEVVYELGKKTVAKKTATKAEAKPAPAKEEEPKSAVSEDSKKIRREFVAYCNANGVDWQKYGLTNESSDQAFIDALNNAKNIVAEREGEGELPFPLE